MNKLPKTDTEKLRTRFLRWLGQICKDEHYTRLLQSNYNGWMFNVRSSNNLPINIIKMTVSRESLKKYWTTALKRADLEQLQKLDIIILDEKLESK